MTQPAGWYDDPENGDNLRYWDGVEWTSHTSPKRKPNLDQAGQASQTPWGAAPGQPAGQAGHQQHGQAQHDPYAGGTQPPFQGQQWQPMPGGHQLHHVPGPTTPDGQPLASWWHRVGARLIDIVLVVVVGMLLMPVVAPGYWSGLLDFTASQPDPFAPLPADLAEKQLRWALTIGIFGLLYEIVLVRTFGGTVGKLITGLRIRLRDEPGNIGWVPALLRALVYQGVGVLAQLSTALSFLAFFPLLDVLWPLWDAKNQAIHDKVAKTNVVRHH